MQTLSIDSYSFGEFCQMVQTAILDGYRFDFDSNENYPTTFGSHYHVIMVSALTSFETTEVPVGELEETKSKPGRKAKLV